VSKHIHTFTTVEQGVDQCTDCPTVRHNPHTAIDHVELAECPCGRGLARFLDGDRTPEPVCASCLSEVDHGIQEVA
jgi:hypothetical protein